MAAQFRRRRIERILPGQSVPLQRRYDHHAVTGGHPMGRLLPRLLRRQALQRFPREFGHQPGRVLLRYRQGRQQGHHQPRGPAGCGETPGRGNLSRPRRTDHPRRTRRGRRPAGRDHRIRRYRAGQNRLVEPLPRSPQRRRTLFRAGLALRPVAARARDRRGRRGQPDGRGPGIRRRGHLLADAYALPPRYGADARRVLGFHRSRRRLRRRRRLRIPAHRPAAACRRRGGFADQPDRHQQGGRS